MASEDREKIENEVRSTSENTESENKLDPQSLSDVDETKAISEFSFKLVNSVKSMNLGEISYY